MKTIIHILILLVIAPFIGTAESKIAKDHTFVWRTEKNIPVKSTYFSVAGIDNYYAYDARQREAVLPPTILIDRSTIAKKKLPRKRTFSS